MKTATTLLLCSALLVGCCTSEPEVPPTPQQATPVAVVIDDTPVLPLQVGGSISLLQDSGDVRDPLAPAWRYAQ